jgi:hypothetical protein
MNKFLAVFIAVFALSAYAAPKKPCKEGQTPEADNCHVVKKAEKKPVEKKSETKPTEKKAAEKPAAKPADKPAEKK